MLMHPRFDPVAISFGPYALGGHVFGPLSVHWYGLTYMAGFALFVLLAGQRTRLPWFARDGWTRADVEDLLFYGVLGVVIGGRLGYVLFYKPAYYLSHLAEVFAVWRGGMSFHGGLIGVIAAMALFARRRDFRWWQVTDLIAPCVPLGLACGRIGNFINGELWGRAADPSLPWAMVFPQSGTPEPRHPSQLYQFGLEGVLLFVLLWIYARQERGPAQVSGAFLIGYGILRFIAEYFREPDAFLGPLALGLSMGQWLCVPMVAIGAVLWVRGRPDRAPQRSIA